MAFKNLGSNDVAKMADQYILWLKNDFVYKRVISLFFPLFAANVAVYEIFKPLGRNVITIAVCIIYIAFSVAWIRRIPCEPIGKSFFVPTLGAIFFILLSAAAIFVCLVPEVRGPYSAYFWGDDASHSVSWALFMYGAFGFIYMGFGYFRVSYINLRRR